MDKVPVAAPRRVPQPERYTEQMPLRLVFRVASIPPIAEFHV